ncbi:MAG: PH domain-containing protein [Candidatus Thermoplasmatota archaeon]|nr:PH domain-containing protein [Candidatus Thermoplasmatota archaeon]MED6313375.1 PH domain-containing protein [Candidatus Thermoplasmatota archaeon]MEE3303363.1 PH domain-containing protein [Candidatus Thermoplasmatota archaeon]
MQEGPGYADSGQIMAVEFDKKIIIYWWIMANFGLMISFIGIPLMLIWIPFGWLVHMRQYEHMSGGLTDRSLNMRMGWIFKKQQNIALDKLTDVSISEGPVLKAFGVVKMQFETAGAAPFILTGVKNSNQFRDLVLQHRDSLVSNPQKSSPSEDSNNVLVEIRDLLKEINTNLSSEE